MTVDFRVLPTAAVVWAMTVAGLVFGWHWVVLIGAGAVATALVVAIRSLRWRPAAVLVVVLGALATSWIGSVLHGSQAHPLRLAAEHGAVVTLRLEITDRPHVLRTAGFGGRQGGTDRVAVPAGVPGGEVLVLAPAQGWADLLPGQAATVTGRLAPARAGELTVAVVEAKGLAGATVTGADMATGRGVAEVWFAQGIFGAVA